MPRHLAHLALAAGLAACSAAPPVLPPPRPPPPLPAPPVRSPSFVATEPPEASRVLEIHLTPVREASGDVTHVDLTLRLSEPPGEFGDASPLVLTVADDEAGDGGFAEAIEDVYARDSEGALGLKQKAIPATAERGAHTEWRSDRHPDGAINLAYRVRLTKGEGRKFQGTRAHAGGFQGTGSTLLLLPDTADTYATHIEWDLTTMGDDATARSTFGEDTVQVSIPLERLHRAIFMAGSLGSLVVDDGAEHVSAAWLGRPGFDPLELVPWMIRARAAERRLFRDADPEVAPFFLRAVPRLGAEWSVSDRPPGLLLLAGDEVGFTRETRFGLARALVRRWIGPEGVHLAGAEGAGAWLGLGVAAHVTRDALLRAGLCTPAEALEDLRAHVERLTLSAVQGVSNDEIGKRFASSDEIRRLAEDRGMLYAAEVDAAIQAKSSGKSALIDLLGGLLARARLPKAGDDKATGPLPPLPAMAFRDALGEELGPDAQARYDAVIVRGEKALPPSDAYGPCFKSVKKAVARRDLGFDDASLQDKRVHGLRATSAAGRAGLVEGEIITRAQVGASAEEPVEITVVRNGVDKVIRYVPRGDTVNGVVWVRVAGVPDSACGRPLPAVVVPPTPAP